jgi:ABC-type spermidine/putrescine transport system permease subunit I
VTRKANPTTKAINLILLVSILTRLEYSGREISSSEVTSRTKDVTANQRLMSDSDSGKIISNQAVIILYSTSVVWSSRITLIFCIVTGLPTCLAIAQAIALAIGHPNKSMLSGLPLGLYRSM